MIRLLIFTAIIALFSKQIFKFVYNCIRKLSAFWESEDDLSTKYQNKINAERSFDYELKQQEKEIKEKQEKLNNYKKKTEAQAAQKIAEVKGMADAEKMKAVTDAERQAELAKIEAEKRVTVEKLAKEEALVKAQKALELATIVKKEEAVKLETIKIQAEQKIAEAQAKQKQIQLSGAITEEAKYRLDTEKETKIGVAKAFAEGVKNIKLPETMIVGGVEPGKAVNAVETFFQLMNIQKAKELQKCRYTDTTKGLPERAPLFFLASTLLYSITRQL